MFHEFATLVHPIKSSKRAARTQGIRLGRAPGGTPASRGATVPRERSYKQLVARQDLPSKENSWRFRINLAYVGESALPTGQRELSWCTAFSATSHGLGMTLEMTLVYPVQWGVAIRRTRLTPCASPMFCFVVLFHAIREIVM